MGMAVSQQKVIYKNNNRPCAGFGPWSGVSVVAFAVDDPIQSCSLRYHLCLPDV